MRIDDPKKLREEVASSRKSSFAVFEGQEESIRKYAESYIGYLNTVKTEREAVDFTVAELEKLGFRKFEYGAEYAAGDKIYYNNRGKALIAARIGSEPVDEGLRIVASHIDCPRIDLKPHPVFEDADMCYFKSHYYGGIKKYQWVSIPLAMHATVALKDGKTLRFTVGEKAGEPVFVINDLLPHLDKNVQGKRTAHEVISGEEMNIIVGDEPILNDDVKDPVKLAVLKRLYDDYGITEDDLISSEIEFVPALKANFVGFDRSMVGGYGQDDRICAYSSTTAFLDAQAPKHTAVLVLADKEETGSNGITGLDSEFLQSFVISLCKATGCDYLKALVNSKCLSSDVSAAYDPNFGSAYEPMNASKINFGPSIEKYTGGGGKYSTSEACAEYVAYIRNMMDSNGIPYQADELGKIDEGGGGTVAQYIAKLQIDVIDVGAPVLAMHSPYEVTGICDVYALNKLYNIFFID